MIVREMTPASLAFGTLSGSCESAVRMNLFPRPSAVVIARGSPMVTSAKAIATSPAMMNRVDNISRDPEGSGMMTALVA